MKIYVASSWKNMLQPGIVRVLRGEGHEVYDFRNPPNKTGFSWSEIDPNWKNWTHEEYLAALEHVRSVEGYNSDMDAMKWADAGVLVLGAGDSAHLELGWFAGQPDKRAIILLQPDYDDMEAREYLQNVVGHSMSTRACSPCGDLDGCWLKHPHDRPRRQQAVRHRPFEPELMYKMADYICLNLDEVIHALGVEAASIACT